VVYLATSNEIVVIYTRKKERDEGRREQREGRERRKMSRTEGEFAIPQAYLLYRWMEREGRVREIFGEGRDYLCRIVVNKSSILPSRSITSEIWIESPLLSAEIISPSTLKQDHKGEEGSNLPIR
jgi:hypothetical protein